MCQRAENLPDVTQNLTTQLFCTQSTVTATAVAGQTRYASSHSENTNQYIREVLLPSGCILLGPMPHLSCIRCPVWYMLSDLYRMQQVAVSWTQALNELEYPAKLQRLLLTPEREVSVLQVVYSMANDATSLSTPDPCPSP